MSDLVPRTTREELEEARESLEFWERRCRARGRGRRARAQRREAEEHVDRCRKRIADLERELYGAGAQGALVQLAQEGRLPEPARELGRRLARHGRTALVVAAAATVTFAVLVVAVVIAIVAAIL